MSDHRKEHKNRMKLCRSALCGGVRLNTVRTDRFKTAHLTVNFFVPLRKETASAYSLLTDVLMRGTEQYPTMRDLNRRQDELYSLGLGAYVQKKGEAQLVTFELTCIDDAYAFDGMRVLEEGMELLQELIFRPCTENGVFRSAYVEQEKKNLSDDIRSRIDNKASYARRRCIEIMCEGEPYAVDHGGDLEEIEKQTAASLWEVYRDLLSSARVEIFYIGKKTEEEVAGLCKRCLPFAPREASFPVTTQGSAPAEPRRVTEQMRISQCKLSVGFRAPYTLQGGDFAKMSLFNEVFGGSPSSRLFTNVREKKSLCYYCSSGPDGLKGILLVNSGIEQKNKQAALDAILEQLEDLRAGKLTEEELETARRSLRNGYREITDSPASVCSWYLGRISAGRTDSPEEMAQSLDAVSVGDVVKVANDLTLDTVYYLEGESKGASV